jgi:hypothetical protein
LRHPVAVIGALSLIGRPDDAARIYQTLPLSNETDLAVALRFYLAIGYTRLSKYKDAKSLLVTNLKYIKQKPSAHELFYIYQGLGFYKYISGKFNLAHRYAKLSRDNAITAGFIYGRALSEDLYAHSCIKIGYISEGLRHFNEAIKAVKLIGDGALSETIKTSVSIYKAKFQLNAPEAIRLLQRKLSKLKQNDNYSASSLLIELAELYINAGQSNIARHTLNTAADFIYSNKNYRHEIMINLKFARLHYNEGNIQEALANINLCKRIIDPLVDKLLQLEILQLEVKILKQKDNEEIGEKASVELDQLAILTGEYLHTRMTMRHEQQNPKVKSKIYWRAGEDILGDIYDLKDQNKKITEILRTGYLSLLSGALNLENEANHIVLDLQPNSITILYNGEIRHFTRVLTPILRKLILTFNSSGPLNRQSIAESVWGYNYDALAHDAMIYATLNRLRRSLAEFSHLLILTEQGYSFRAECKILVYKPTAAQNFLNSPSSTFKLPIARQQDSDHLNYRQLEMLDYLNQNNFIDINYCIKSFSVSKITASRDLSKLYFLKRVSRIGKGRATKYTKIA